MRDHSLRSSVLRSWRIDQLLVAQRHEIYISGPCEQEGFQALKGFGGQTSDLEVVQQQLDIVQGNLGSRGVGQMIRQQHTPCEPYQLILTQELDMK